MDTACGNHAKSEVRTNWRGDAIAAWRGRVPVTITDAQLSVPIASPAVPDIVGRDGTGVRATRTDALEPDTGRNTHGHRTVFDRAVAKLRAVVRAPAEDGAVFRQAAGMTQAGSDGRKRHVPCDFRRLRVRSRVGGSDSKLAELVGSPAVRVATIGQRTGVIGASRHRYETERLERDEIDMNGHGADDDHGKSAEAPHVLHLLPTVSTPIQPLNR